ncbi:lysosomal amino acid transporter [Anaeramoeba flamelloides]|uniref:Lysosomal amino acid transporter n=1 Tax=Anaeramoeba flamelloides TaxID=1746091 RepID=A0AAV7ZMA2_9EUKA|nr:lysosomal amino acid transporter [Anaeramoeba flamelloides]
MNILLGCTPAIKNGKHFNKAINKLMGDCIWSTKDYFSFFIGLSSILCWLTAQAPQVLLNYKNKSSSSLSLALPVFWFVSDTIDSVGCFLANQLAPQKVSALYFWCLDVVLLSQYYYYSCVRKKKKQKNDFKKIDKKSINDRLPTLIEEDILNLESGLENSDNEEISSNLDSTVELKVVFFLLSIGVLGFIKFKTENICPNFVNRSLLGIKKSKIEYITGTVFGWVCQSIVFSSRMPQIYKNYKRKSTSGLSLQLFVAALFGNITYALGILLRSTEWSFLKTKLPWLVGSLGTLNFDLFIISQFYRYRKNSKQNNYSRILSNEYDQKNDN